MGKCTQLADCSCWAALSQADSATRSKSTQPTTATIVASTNRACQRVEPVKRDLRPWAVLTLRTTIKPIMAIVEAKAINSTSHSQGGKCPISGSAQSGLKICA